MGFDYSGHSAETPTYVSSGFEKWAVKIGTFGEVKFKLSLINLTLLSRTVVLDIDV